MTKILFLLPPSEWKNSENKYSSEELNFKFEKPINIANNVSEKDLKCKWDRFLEWLELNKNIKNSETIEAIKRYSWVMFNAIDYCWMKENWKEFFEENFLILSGMYWIVKPLDIIWNYKLPIDSKWLFDFWEEKIVKKIAEIKPDFVVNLLPISYSKLLWLAKCRKHIYKREFLIKSGIKILNINFLKENWDKISHWVKKIKWEWIKNICENQMENSTITPFLKGDENIKKIIDINIIIK
jgi:cytoplasmic iron level regulating protein YaaA (DUF328/UPF0246 family)